MPIPPQHNFIIGVEYERDLRDEISHFTKEVGAQLGLGRGRRQAADGRGRWPRPWWEARSCKYDGNRNRGCLLSPDRPTDRPRPRLLNQPTSSGVTVTRVSDRGGEGRDSPLTLRGSTKVTPSEDADVVQQKLPMLHTEHAWHCGGDFLEFSHSAINFHLRSSLDEKDG